MEDVNIHLHHPTPPSIWGKDFYFPWDLKKITWCLVHCRPYVFSPCSDLTDLGRAVSSSLVHGTCRSLNQTLWVRTFINPHITQASFLLWFSSCGFCYLWAVDSGLNFRVNYKDSHLHSGPQSTERLKISPQALSNWPKFSALEPQHWGNKNIH